MTNLSAILKNHLGGKEHSICDLECSCCSSVFKVMDFDKIKDAFCINFSIPEHAKLASADGLHINDAKKRVCFIEMKDINKFLSATLFASGTSDSTDEIRSEFDFKAFRRLFDAWLDDKNRSLRNKVADSVFITISALTKYSANTTDAAEFIDKNKVEIKYVALLNISSENFIKYKLAGLNQRLAYGMLTGPQCIPAVIRAVGFDKYVSSELI